MKSPLACVLCALMLLPRVGRAQSADDLQLAKEHFQIGISYYDKGRFPEAASEFETSYKLSRRADLLYNMGKAYQGAGDPAKALGAYRDYLRQVPLEAPDRPDVEQRVAGLQAKIALVRIVGAQPQSRVFVNQLEVGRTPLGLPLELNPGNYKIDIEREGFATWHNDIRTSAGQKISLQVTQLSLVKIVEVPVAGEKVPVYKKWWLWTAVGIGVAAIALGVGLGIGLNEKGSAPSGTTFTVPGVNP